MVKEISWELEDELNWIVVVDFWAPWCWPCKLSKPIFEELSNEMNIKFLSVNVDDSENTWLVEEYWIKSIPKVILFNDYNQVDSINWMFNKQSLINLIEKELW